MFDAMGHLPDHRLIPRLAPAEAVEPDHAATARAYSCSLWVVWRDGPRLDILDQVIGSGRRLPRSGAAVHADRSKDVPMAKLVDVGSIGSYFESHSDPRHARNRKHLLVDIAVCGIVCGCDGPTAIHRWAKHRASWLAQHLTLPNGIPSRDCIRRLLVALKPEAFQRCFQAWVGDAIATDGDTSERLVAIDGKTCRRSHDAAKDLGALHIVSAWTTEEGIALGQVATEAKSNEITAIPQLLEQIDLDGTLITIDAMGCQREIVAQVVTGGGDCVIAVKDNQPKLLAAMRGYFLDHLESQGVRIVFALEVLIL